jgi:heat shock protein HslJ
MLNRFGVFSLLVMCFGAFCLLGNTAAAESSPAPSQPATLETVEWTLTEMNGKPMQSAAKGRQTFPTLRFSAEKKQASGFSGVNRFFGSYEREDEKLKFGPLAGTRMAGPPEAMELEKDFVTMLRNVTHFRISNGMLELLQSEQVVARFSATKAAER